MNILSYCLSVYRQKVTNVDINAEISQRSYSSTTTGEQVWQAINIL